MTLESTVRAGDLASETRRSLTLRHIEHVRAGTTDAHPDEERAVIEPFHELTRAALEDEDYAQVPGINQAMRSGLRDSLLIGENEPSLTGMHRSMARALGRPDPDQPAPPEQRSVR